MKWEIIHSFECTHYITLIPPNILNYNGGKFKFTFFTCPRSCG